MSYEHCDPCDHFDYCACCEQEMCLTCGENFNSEHMHLNDEAHQKLMNLIDEGLLMAAAFCRECLFHAHANVNDPEQAEYNHNLIYEIQEEQFETVVPFHGKVIQIKKSLKIVGKKPKRTFETRKGAFYFPAPTGD